MKRDGLSVKVPVSGQSQGIGDDIKYAHDAIQSGQWAYGKYNEHFSKFLAEYVGTRYATLCNSGSSADLLAVGALKSSYLDDPFSNRDYIITTALAFPTTVNAIILNGFTPVFVDCDLETLNPDMNQVQDAIWKLKNNEEWKKIGLLFTHTLGNPFDIDRALEFNLPLIEDNCDALGSEWNGKKTGSFGDLATQSFYPAHHMSTGEGGAVLCNSPKIQRAVESLMSWGKDCWCAPGFDNTCGKRFNQDFRSLPEGYDHKYIFSQIGYNLKMTNIQAALGCGQIQVLPEWVEIRRRNWQNLIDSLGFFYDYFIFQRSYSEANPSWFGFVITLREDIPFTRKEMINYLEEHGVATRPVFAGNITRQPAYKKAKMKIINNLKNTDYVMENTFWIGCWHGLSDLQIEYAIDVVREFVRLNG